MQGTDNSLLDAKVQLRIDHMPKGAFIVLDAFAGFGKTWEEVATRTGRKDIYRMGIDAEQRPGCVRGDNRKWLKGIDLARFNVIDLDAYGIPFDQMEILFRRKYSGVVFFTFILSVMGMCPERLLKTAGVTKEIRRKCPTIWGHVGWIIWLDWLAANGVKQVFHRSKYRKHYGCFVLD